MTTTLMAAFPRLPNSGQSMTAASPAAPPRGSTLVTPLLVAARHNVVRGTGMLNAYLEWQVAREPARRGGGISL
jgi:hypothetical protein